MTVFSFCFWVNYAFNSENVMTSLICQAIRVHLFSSVRQISLLSCLFSSTGTAISLLINVQKGNFPSSLAIFAKQTQNPTRQDIRIQTTKPNHIPCSLEETRAKAISNKC